MKKHPIVYRALWFREPVALHPEFAEIVPIHADMLRYDQAFHHPADVSLVVFPLFRHPQYGKYPDGITPDAWRSYRLRLETFADLGQHPDDAGFPEGIGFHTIHNLDEWVTYQRESPAQSLKPMTMREYLVAHPKMAVAGWRLAA